MQNQLFDHQESADPLVILAKDGQAEYLNSFLDVDAADSLFKTLLGSPSWESDQIQMFGKLLTTARKVVWVGDPECCILFWNSKNSTELDQ